MRLLLNSVVGAGFTTLIAKYPMLTSCSTIVLFRILALVGSIRKAVFGEVLLPTVACTRIQLFCTPAPLGRITITLSAAGPTNCPLISNDAFNMSPTVNRDPVCGLPHVTQ